jgi:hypothetical protein
MKEREMEIEVTLRDRELGFGGNAEERKGEERWEGQIEEFSRMPVSAALLSIVFSTFTDDSILTLNLFSLYG